MVLDKNGIKSICFNVNIEKELLDLDIPIPPFIFVFVSFLYLQIRIVSQFSCGLAFEFGVSINEINEEISVFLILLEMQK